MKLIPLSQNSKSNKGKYFAQVDDEDFEWLNQFRWCAAKFNNCFYAMRGKINDGIRITIYMHREVMRFHNLLDELKQIDHKDHNGLNNQKNNIRNATFSENRKNKTAYGTSKYLGVHLHIGLTTRNTKKYGITKSISTRWAASINNNKKSVFLGCFKEEINAAIAYNKAAKKYHGEFANLNQIVCD